VADRIAGALSSIGDIDADTNPDLLVGIPGYLNGAAWVLLLAGDGSVRRGLRLESAPELANVRSRDRFGSAVGWIPSSSDDGLPSLLVAAPPEFEGYPSTTTSTLVCATTTTTSTTTTTMNFATLTTGSKTVHIEPGLRMTSIVSAATGRRALPSGACTAIDA
jgi:hypothetical protein